LPALARLADRLLPGGRLVLVQSIPRHVQRLYDLVSWGRAGALREKVVAAEEAIYAATADPLVNWDEDELRAALEKAGLVDVRLSVEAQAEERLLTGAHMERWFGEKDPVTAGEGNGARLSYRERLREGGLTAAEVERVAKLFREQVLEQTVTWNSRVAYIRAEK